MKKENPTRRAQELLRLERAAASPAAPEPKEQKNAWI